MSENIIFVFDGSKKILAGLSLFLSGFQKFNERMSVINLLAPHWANKKNISLLTRTFPEFKIQVHQITHPKHEDAYFVKFVLLKFISGHGFADNDTLLYIDYDHVVFNELPRLSYDSEEIQVSSEVKELDIHLMKDEISSNEIRLHFNTSVIGAKVSTLRNVGDSWLMHYQKLFPYVPKRHLEEISFSNACLGEKINIKPVSLDFQGGWHGTTGKTSIFHYGGAHNKAYDFKRFVFSRLEPFTSDALSLRKASSNLALELTCIETITDSKNRAMKN